MIFSIGDQTDIDRFIEAMKTQDPKTWRPYSSSEPFGCVYQHVYRATNRNFPIFIPNWDHHGLCVPSVITRMNDSSKTMREAHEKIESYLLEIREHMKSH